MEFHISLKTNIENYYHLLYIFYYHLSNIEFHISLDINVENYYHLLNIYIHIYIFVVFFVL